jgi:hypothetical protein
VLDATGLLSDTDLAAANGARWNGGTAPAAFLFFVFVFSISESETRRHFSFLFLFFQLVNLRHVLISI